MISENELQELNAAKNLYLNAEYGTYEYFQAFITWHNISFRLSEKVDREEMSTLFPFNMKGYEIGLKDLAGEMKLAEKFLENKKKTIN